MDVQNEENSGNEMEAADEANEMRDGEDGGDRRKVKNMMATGNSQAEGRTAWVANGWCPVQVEW